MEAAKRLEGKVAVSAQVKPSAYLGQIRALTPWHLEHVQIYRQPKTRRVPSQRIMTSPNITHRGAALLYTDGTIEIESQDIAHLERGATQTRFDRAVRVAIFIYGTPMTLTGQTQRRRAREQAELDRQPQPEEILEDWQPGAKDIQFPGITSEAVPLWMQGVLKRLHTNLGHPSNATLVRQLSQAQASTQALIGARALKCPVCERLRGNREARPSKTPGPARTFNQRLVVDLVYVHDLSGETHVFIETRWTTCMTTYQVMTRLQSREASCFFWSSRKHFG